MDLCHECPSSTRWPRRLVELLPEAALHKGRRSLSQHDVSESFLNCTQLGLALLEACRLGWCNGNIIESQPTLIRPWHMSSLRCLLRCRLSSFTRICCSSMVPYIPRIVILVSPCALISGGPLASKHNNLHGRDAKCTLCKSRALRL